MKRALKITTLFIVIISIFTLSAYAQKKTMEWEAKDNDDYSSIICMALAYSWID